MNQFTIIWLNQISAADLTNASARCTHNIACGQGLNTKTVDVGGASNLFSNQKFPLS